MYTDVYALCQKNKFKFQFIHYSSAGKESVCSAGDLGLIAGLKQSPGEGNSYLL